MLGKLSSEKGEKYLGPETPDRRTSCPMILFPWPRVTPTEPWSQPHAITHQSHPIFRLLLKFDPFIQIRASP